MADVKLRMQVNPNAGEETIGTITNYDSGDTGTNSNVSNTSIKANENGVYSDIENASGEGSNGLTWAWNYENSEDNYLVFNQEDYVDNVENSSAYLESELSPSEFVWGVVPESKEYHVKLTFTNANNLKDVQFRGDVTARQFPTRAIIDGLMEIVDDDDNWIVSFQNESDTHTIEFTHWNRSNYNAVLTKIGVTPSFIEIISPNIKGFEGLIQSLPNVSEPKFSVYYGQGSVEVLDINDEIRDLFENKAISLSNVDLDIEINGKINRVLKSSDSDYNSANSTVSFQTTDELSKWEQIIIPSRDLTYRKNAYELLVELFSYYGKNSEYVDSMLTNKMLSNEQTEITVKSFFENYIIEHPFWNSENLRSIVEKFCQISQTCIYADEKGKISFVSVRPIVLGEVSPIAIPAKNQISIPSSEVFIKNDYDNVLYKYYENNEVIKESVWDSGAISISESSSGGYYAESSNPQVEVSSYYNNGSYWATARCSVDLNNLITDNRKFVKDVENMQIYAFLKGTEREITYEGNLSREQSVESLEFESLKTQENGGLSVQKSISNEGIMNIIASIQIANPYDGVVPEGSTVEDWIGSSFNIQIVADCVYFYEKQETINTRNNNVFEYPLNQFMQTSSYELVKNSALSIFEDYGGSGKRTCKVSVSCGDYYRRNGDIAKTWAIGETFNIGDIVVIDKDNSGNSLWKLVDGSDVVWRVVGANLRKKGVPVIDLELQEVKQK